MATGMQRGTVAGLALLFLLHCAAADEVRRNMNYVLVDREDGTRTLLMLLPDDGSAPDGINATTLDPDRKRALALLQDSTVGNRVNGLLLLSGDADFESLQIAMMHLTDADDAVREEAEALVADHPLADDALRALYPLEEDE